MCVCVCACVCTYVFGHMSVVPGADGVEKFMMVPLISQSRNVQTQAHTHTHTHTHTLTDRWTHMDVWMDERMDGWIDTNKNGRMD